MDLISDGLLLAAALAAIFYCWALSRRLGGLKGQSAELAERLREFDDSIAEARRTIVEGRSIASAELDSLADLVASARTVRAELEDAKDALEASIGQAQQEPEPPEVHDPLDGLRKMVRRRNLRNAS